MIIVFGNSPKRSLTGLRVGARPLTTEGIDGLAVLYVHPETRT